MVMWKRGMAIRVTPIQEAPRVRTLDLKTYARARDARELNNILWQLEQYFETIGLKEEKAKVCSFAMFFIDTIMMWWCKRHVDIKRGTYTIDTWEDFKKEIKKQFYPKNVEYLAGKSLKQLKHTGTLRDYVKEFSTLMLEIPYMFEKDLFFSFMDSL